MSATMRGAAHVVVVASSIACAFLCACKSDDDDAAASGTGGSGGMVMTGSGGVTGAAGSTGAGYMTATPAGPTTFSAIFSDIISKGAVGNCTFGACHGGAPNPASNGGLQMMAADKLATYNALVGKQSASDTCRGMTYVTAGNPGASLLLQKLLPSPPCGLRMPLAPLGHPLSDGQLAQIAGWITAGANND